MGLIKKNPAARIAIAALAAIATLSATLHRYMYVAPKGFKLTEIPYNDLRALGYESGKVLNAALKPNSHFYAKKPDGTYNFYRVDAFKNVFLAKITPKGSAFVVNKKEFRKLEDACHYVLIVGSFKQAMHSLYKSRSIAQVRASLNLLVSRYDNGAPTYVETYKQKTLRFTENFFSSIRLFNPAT